MTAQIRNAPNVTLLAADFQARYEPQFSLAIVESLHCQLQGLRAFWPMGPNTAVGTNYHASDVASSYDIKTENNPLFSRYNLAPYVDFVAASSQYLEYLDITQFQIQGNEPFIANPGLTLGGWFWCDAASMGAAVGYMAKYNAVGNQQAYELYKGATDFPTFGISTDGINNVYAIHTTVQIVGTWNHIVGRFTPSTELAIFLNGVKITNVVAIPATIFNSTASLRIGDIRATYLDGRASQCFICAAWLSDAQIGMLYQAARPMFGV